MDNIKLIPGYENYGVTSDGRVINTLKGNVLKPIVGTKGHLQVGLYKYVGAPCKLCSIDSLVAKLYLKPVIGATRLKHKDGDISNNKAENLEWIEKKGTNSVNNWGMLCQWIRQKKFSNIKFEMIDTFIETSDTLIIFDATVDNEFPMIYTYDRNGTLILNKMKIGKKKPLQFKKLIEALS